MIDRPPALAALTVGDARLLLDQQPTARMVPVDLRAGQQMRITGQQLLQLGFCVIGGTDSLGQEPVVTNQENRI
jgi:hypothetical protein